MILDTKKVDPCNEVKVKKDKVQNVIQSSVVNEFGEKRKRRSSDDRSREDRLPEKEEDEEYEKEEEEQGQEEETNNEDEFQIAKA
ncbi:hypothetical protein L6452_36323 [Arctium lappa]|uniref:Uncharacterized protein n=1 Tax=Arctium lappa TaxID=4217 RepID=A0ACB8Y9G9_ARCLA|nr:hypothetical protein L6452_36323 [Arctium lappa]